MECGCLMASRRRIRKQYEQDVRDKLKYLDYAPLLFISAADGKNIESVFKKVELVARERRKRVTTGQMNKFLEKVDFQKASVPMNKRRADLLHDAGCGGSADVCAVYR